MIELLSGHALLTAGAAFLIGLLIGSFLNVVIYRVPKMLERAWRRECLELDGKTPPDEPVFNLLTPAVCLPGLQGADHGAAEHPGASATWRWAASAGAASGPSALRYPLVELLTGVLSALVAYKFGFTWTTGAALVLTWFLIALAFIDIDTQLLPDSMTLPLLWIGLAVAAACCRRSKARGCRWTCARRSSARSPDT